MRPFLCFVLALSISAFVTALPAQQPDAQTAASPAVSQDSSQQTQPAAAPATPQQATTQNIADASAQPQSDVAKRFTVPAGTQVLLTLQAPINTKTAHPGNGVYLRTIFPITIGNTIAIPVGSFVQGTIDHVVRPGRVKGRAQVEMHFTTLIFPSGYTVSLPAVLDDVPGESGVHKKNGEGTLEHDSQKGRDIARIGEGAAIGAISTAGTLNGKAIGIGSGAGAAAGALVALLTRGDDIRIEAGAQVEMLLQRPLVLEEQKVEEANGTRYQMIPVETNRVLSKPNHTMSPARPCITPMCL